MTEPVATVVVCDAGTLIHLHEIGCLGLLADALLRELPARSTLHLKRSLLHEIIARVERGE